MALSLDRVFSILGVDPLASGVQVLSAEQIAPPQLFDPLLPFNSRQPLLVCNLADEAAVERVRATLQTLYDATHPVTLVSDSAETTTIADMVSAARPGPGLCIYVSAQAILDAVRSFDALLYITARLRAPGGCPWDRQQTHNSLKPYVLEEAYEVLEALDRGDLAMLAEELGDLMLQVVIQAQVAAEAGEFDIGDVLAAISSKLIRRHPHVFSGMQVSGSQEVLRNWQAIKQAEKRANGADEEGSSLLGSVPTQLPALAYAQAIQERAGRVGLGQDRAEDVRNDVVRALAELDTAHTTEQRIERYGDLLVALVHMAQQLDVNAEEALRLAVRRYRERFLLVETWCRQRGLDLAALLPEERRALWEQATPAADE